MENSTSELATMDKKPFSALILGVGKYGDAFIALQSKRPAYVCRIEELNLVPKEGEIWLVQTIYRNRHITFLFPIRKIA